MRAIALILASVASMLAADLSGKWEFVWGTEGGERRSIVTLTQKEDTVKAEFEGSKSDITGRLDQDKLVLDGTLFSNEGGRDGKFKLEGAVKAETLEGTASWEEYRMTFTARRAK